MKDPNEIIVYAITFLTVLLVVLQVVTVRFTVRRLEAKLDRVMRKLGLDLPASDPLHDRVRELARGGRVIEAVKVLRDESGMSLAEARAVVDGYRSDHDL